MHFWEKILHTFLSGKMQLINSLKAHGQCGGFHNMTFRDKKCKVYKLVRLMPIVQKVIKNDL